MESERHDNGSDGIPSSYHHYGSSVDPPQARAPSDVAVPQTDTMNAPLEVRTRPYSQDPSVATQWGTAAATFPPSAHGRPYYHILPSPNDQHAPGGMHDQSHPAIPSVVDMAGNTYPSNSTQDHQAAPAGGHYEPHPTSSSFDYGAHWYPPSAGPVPPSHNAVGYGPPQDSAAHGWAHHGAAWDTQPPSPAIRLPPANQGTFGGPAEPSVRILWIQRGGDRSTFMMIEIS
ncbi:hypothetical protein BC834DRAFT_359839 [Gloeopeniophorella convolvens]|nr:hypothetical protein BC834DRAFT_359839 [Gloeopeniophorella convolvens]